MIRNANSGYRAVALLVFATTGASHARAPDALFAASDILDVRLTAPFRQIMQERPEVQDVAGRFELIAADGGVVGFDVGIRTRGNFRRQKETCTFAPLRINFRKSQLDGTVFAGQDKLKLVTHCRNRSRVYQQTLLKEYLAYRFLNVLTDISYRVRLLRISYVDTDEGDAEESSYAFFIESDERLAKRIDMQEQKLATVNLAALQADHTNLTSVFEYFIGNVDFSPVKGIDGENCCHNYALFSADGTTYWPIPYDFDLSGLAEAPHNTPNRKLGQLDVRQRIYRGRCVNNDRLPATLQLFRERRDAIEALLAAQQELDNATRRSVAAYVASFYKKIDQKRAPEQLAKSCI